MHVVIHLMTFSDRKNKKHIQVQHPTAGGMNYGAAKTLWHLKFHRIERIANAAMLFFPPYVATRKLALSSETD